MLFVMPPRSEVGFYFEVPNLSKQIWHGKLMDDAPKEMFLKAMPTNNIGLWQPKQQLVSLGNLVCWSRTHERH